MTAVPLMPDAAGVLLTVRLLRLTALVLVSETPGPVVPWIVPPLALPPTLVLPPPSTVSPPALPVALRRMPLAAPFALTDRNFRPVAPIVVLSTTSVEPVVLVRVEVVSEAVTVPPPVALKALSAPDEIVSGW